jgi:hypothetical protein
MTTQHTAYSRLNPSITHHHSPAPCIYLFRHTPLTMSNPAPVKQKAIFESLTEYGESALDNGWLPDAVLRPVIRKLNRVRLAEIDKGQ